MKGKVVEKGERDRWWMSLCILHWPENLPNHLLSRVIDVHSLVEI
jgi:hypothetical protein